MGSQSRSLTESLTESTTESISESTTDSISESVIESMSREDRRVTVANRARHYPTRNGPACLPWAHNPLPLPKTQLFTRIHKLVVGWLAPGTCVEIYGIRKVFWDDF